MTKIILWDWDNTLANTFAVILRAQNAMRKHYGLGEWTAEEAKEAMNLSGKNIIKNLVGEEKSAEARVFYLEKYKEYAVNLELKEGAVALLDYARKAGYVNILASNKTKSILAEEVKKFGILDKFDRIVGAGEAEEDKPSKKFTDKAVEGLEPIDVLVSIGDGLSDIKMARNCDGVSILVFTDPNSPEFKKENIKPDYCAESLSACQKILASLSSNGRQIPNERIQDYKDHTR